MTVVAPKLTLERRLLRECDVLIALDEVGRGALAGPVAVGAVAIDLPRARKRVPEGLRDSKLVPPGRRGAVAERARAWVSTSAVGWASAQEIDSIGIMRALGIAATRAITELDVIDPAAAVILLDGNYDYVSPVSSQPLQIRPVIRADRDCASAAAASVIAKVARDALMTSLHDEAPQYNWAHNKGYASPTHRDAIAEHGLSRHHRHSWAIAAAPTLF